MTAPVFMGKCAIRVQVQPGDVDSDQTDRAEITGTATQWRNGDEVWYSLPFMLDPSHPLPPAGGWMLVHQFFAQDLHNWISGGSPPLAIEITPSGSIDADLRGGVKASAYQPAPRGDEYHIAPATAGVWHTLLIHIKWSTGSDGLVQIWHRQGNNSFTTTPQVSAPGPNVLTVAGDVLPVYAETGIYRSRSVATQTVYYAGLSAQPTRAAAEAAFARQTLTRVACSPTARPAGSPATCSVIATDADTGPASKPTGSASLSSLDAGATLKSQGCTLAARRATGNASRCSLNFTPQRLSRNVQTAVINGTYAGDELHLPSMTGLASVPNPTGSPFTAPSRATSGQQGPTGLLSPAQPICAGGLTLSSALGLPVQLLRTGSVSTNVKASCSGEYRAELTTMAGERHRKGGRRPVRAWPLARGHCAVIAAGSCELTLNLAARGRRLRHQPHHRRIVLRVLSVLTFTSQRGAALVSFRIVTLRN